MKNYTIYAKVIKLISPLSPELFCWVTAGPSVIFHGIETTAPKIASAAVYSDDWEKYSELMPFHPLFSEQNRAQPGNHCGCYTEN